MKRFFHFIGIVLLVGVIFAVGAYGEPYTDPMPTPTPEPTPQPDRDAEAPDPNALHPAIVEYGSSTVIVHNNDPLHAYIRFPQAGNPSDYFIAGWAHTLFNYISDNMDAVLNNDPTEIGEINVQFDSFLIDNRYVGIFQSGRFTYTLAGEPEEIIQTFNIDLLTYEFLEPFDILDRNALESLLNLLNLRLLVEHPRTDGNIHNMDESWLHNLFIGHEGIVVVIPQFAGFLPDEFETLTVTLPYESLGSDLLIRNEPFIPMFPPEPPPDATIPQDDDDGFDDEFRGDEWYDDESYDEGYGIEGDLPTDQIYPSVPPQSSVIDPALPMIALSFDDGPGNYLDDFLDLLELYNVRATFCVLGNLVNTQPDGLRRAVELGNEVIGHSWDHRNLAKLTDNDVRSQIQTTGEAIEAITGTAIPLFRPPFGEVSDTMRRISEYLGFAMVNSNVDPEDWRFMDADVIYNAVLEQAHDGAIIMSHEIFGTTLEAYQRIIPELLSRGFQLVTISELLSHRLGEIEPGRVYFSVHDVS